MVFKKTLPRLSLSLLILILSFDAVLAQYAGSSPDHGLKKDTLLNTQPPKSFFKKDLFRIGLPPAIFFGASALTWSSRKEIREIRNRYIPTFSHHYDNYMQYAPAATVFALKLSGVKGRNKLGRTFYSYVTSAVIMGIIVNSIKYTAKVERPDGSQANSFPSGHTSNSFMNATFMHKEYGNTSPAYSIAGYTMSTITGIGRGLNNRHWISDVLAGAGIGILSTQLGYLIIDKFYKNKGDRLTAIQFGDPTAKPSFLSMKVGYASALNNLVKNFDIGIRSKSGFEAGFEGAWYLNSNWGIGADFAFASFPISTADSKIEDEDFGTIGSEIKTQSVGELGFTVGPHYTYKITPQWLLQLKAGAGISVGANGKVLLKTTDPDEDMNVTENEFQLLSYKPKTTLKVNGGAGITRMLNPELGLTLYGDYNYLNPKVVYSFLSDPSDPNSPLSEKITERNKTSYISAGLKLTAFF